VMLPGRVGGMPPGDGAQRRAGGSGLPCQDSHNSTEGSLRPVFPSSARRTAFALQVNVQAMCEHFGIEFIGFLTLTFADHVLDPREAQRRMNSLSTHVLRPRYRRAIRVIERQKSGRIHYHLLVAVGADIRTGVDFVALSRGDYRSAPKSLRDEWSFWRMTASKFGFGRTELLPIRSTVEAVSRYVGKYISKHLYNRISADKGVRLVSYIGEKIANSRFAWAGGHSKTWRKKLSLFVRMFYESGAIASPTLSAMRMAFGPRWAFKWRDCIVTMPEVDDGKNCGGIA